MHQVNINVGNLTTTARWSFGGKDPCLHPGAPDPAGCDYPAGIDRLGDPDLPLEMTTHDHRTRRTSDASDEEAEQRLIRLQPFHLGRQRIQALQQWTEIVPAGELYTDQRRPGLAIVLLDVLEKDDVVVRAERLIEEASQRTGFLRESRRGSSA